MLRDSERLAFHGPNAFNVLGDVLAMRVLVVKGALHSQGVMERGIHPFHCAAQRSHFGATTSGDQRRSCYFTVSICSPPPRRFRNAYTLTD
jgi:hypothetical protein